MFLFSILDIIIGCSSGIIIITMLLLLLMYYFCMTPSVVFKLSSVFLL